MPVKLGFIIVSLIGVLRIPEEFYLYKNKSTFKSIYFGLIVVNSISSLVWTIFQKYFYHFLKVFKMGDNSIGLNLVL